MFRWEPAVNINIPIAETHLTILILLISVFFLLIVVTKQFSKLSHAERETQSCKIRFVFDSAAAHLHLHQMLGICI